MKSVNNAAMIEKIEPNITEKLSSCKLLLSKFDAAVWKM